MVDIKRIKVGQWEATASERNWKGRREFWKIQKPEQVPPKNEDGVHERGDEVKMYGVRCK